MKWPGAIPAIFATRRQPAPRMSEIRDLVRMRPKGAPAPFSALVGVKFEDVGAVPNR
jgi:hypothetical protein